MALLPARLLCGHSHSKHPVTESLGHLSPPKPAVAKQLTFLQAQELNRGEVLLEREQELEGSNWRRSERKETSEE